MPRKITVRLRPFEARALSQLQTVGLPNGADPRDTTDVVREALLQHYRRVVGQ